jgi:hypothetical protein
MTPISKQAKRYQRFAERRRNAHQMFVDKIRLRHILLCLFMTFIVGVVVVATVYKSAISIESQIMTVVFSVIAFVLSSGLSFVRFTKMAQRHKPVVEAYEANRLNLDILSKVNLETAGTQEALARLKKIAVELKKIGQTAPSVPDSIWNSIKTT